MAAAAVTMVTHDAAITRITGATLADAVVVVLATPLF